MTFDTISVLGAGSWGSALAQAAARAGRRVTLWARNPEAAQRIATTRENPLLPGIRLDDAITVTHSLQQACTADAILLAVPAQALREAAEAARAFLPTSKPLIACAKGIERGSRKFMTEVIAESIPAAIPAILSGPSFAADVARGLPTAVTLAAAQAQTAAALAHSLGSATFRPYHTADLRGVEIGGAAKNVFAIAAGIVAGRKLGASASAALITRSFAELTRFGKAYGAQPETLTGLSGFGDLVLSCASAQSRNFALGMLLGQGHDPEDARRNTKLAEGFFTAAVLIEMAQARDVDMPIAQATAAVLEGRLSVDAAIEQLLTRPFRAEE